MEPLLGLLVLAVVVFVGAVLQGSLGFGIGVVSVPFMLLVRPELVPAAPLLISLPIIVVSLLHERRHIDRSSFLWLTAGRLPGTLIAAALLALLPEMGVRLLAACILTAVAVFMLAARAGSRGRAMNAGTRLGIGTLSGFMATSSGVGGPMLTLAFRGATPRTMRGTINATTLVGAALSLGGTFFAGRIDGSVLLAAGLLLVPALVGLVVSRPIGRHLRSENMSLVVTVSVLVCCAFVVIQLCLQLLTLVI